MPNVLLNNNLEIVQNEPQLPDFDITLISVPEEDPDFDLLSDPMLGSI
tara:strand:+ start:2186 stop:2329 length:144 start_codon:yes stop_codon:yes gene_type:complete